MGKNMGLCLYMLADVCFGRVELWGFTLTRYVYLEDSTTTIVGLYHESGKHFPYGLKH